MTDIVFLANIIIIITLYIVIIVILSINYYVLKTRKSNFIWHLLGENVFSDFSLVTPEKSIIYLLSCSSSSAAIIDKALLSPHHFHFPPLTITALVFMYYIGYTYIFYIQYTCVYHLVTMAISLNTLGLFLFFFSRGELFHLKNRIKLYAHALIDNV